MSLFLFPLRNIHSYVHSYLGGFFNLPLPLFINKYDGVPFPTLFTTRTETALEKLI